MLPVKKANKPDESKYFDSSDHIRMYEKELYEQNDQYLKLLNRSAIELMQEGYIFPSLFLKTADGQLLVKVRKDRGIPRKGEYLTAVVLNDDYGSFKKWGTSSWYNLRTKHQICFSDAVCVWQAESENPDFILLGFTGINIDFADRLKNNMIIIFGPHEPPRDYIMNLKKLTEHDNCGKFICFGNQIYNWDPIEINSKHNFTEFVTKQLDNYPYMLIQGPPGTGKTFQIAALVKELLDKNKSVLVTALTNRALIEVALKPSLEKHLSEGRVFKTNVSIDELNEIPDLGIASSIESNSGTLLLSSFYITSGKALNTVSPIFDYVIMDEASQGLLGMFQASIKLGHKVLWIGDQNQMPPITMIRDHDIRKFNMLPLINGMDSVCKHFSIPSYIMNETYRLSTRAAHFTSKFYARELIAKNHRSEYYTYPGLENDYSHLFHQDGGPSWMQINMQPGNPIPDNGIKTIIDIAKALHKNNKALKIGILTKMKKTVHRLQQVATMEIGNTTQVFIDTVDRVQGMTCDVCIFFIPNYNMALSLMPNFFNVATSRALKHTLIVSDPSIMESSMFKGDVRNYLEELNPKYIH